MNRLDQAKRSIGRRIGDFFTGQKGSIFWLITVVWKFLVELVQAINEAIVERNVVRRRDRKRKLEETERLRRENEERRQ